VVQRVGGGGHVAPDSRARCTRSARHEKIRAARRAQRRLFAPPSALPTAAVVPPPARAAALRVAAATAAAQSSRRCAMASRGCLQGKICSSMTSAWCAGASRSPGPPSRSTAPGWAAKCVRGAPGMDVANWGGQLDWRFWKRL
jgi:hypothetical protein